MYDFIIPMAAGKINLESGWKNVWGIVKSAAPGLSELLLAIGVILVVFALGKWLWDKRKSGGGDSSALMWTAIVGAALAGPEILFPLLLKLVDWLLNGVLGILKLG